MRNDQCSICLEAIAKNEAEARDEHAVAGITYTPMTELEALYYMLDTHDVDAHQFNG